MTKKFIYFYFMRNDPAKIGKFVPVHVNYWKLSQVSGYIGGPFADKSGGAITFRAKDIEEATEIASKDPFILEDLLADKWIKEWITE